MTMMGAVVCHVVVVVLVQNDMNNKQEMESKLEFLAYSTLIVFVCTVVPEGSCCIPSGTSAMGVVVAFSVVGCCVGCSIYREFLAC